MRGNDMEEMTGETLLAQLNQLTPEQRKMPVVCLAHDVGRNRETINNSAHGKIHLTNVNNDGHEEDEGPPNVIQILT